jgi:hypothetical protein
VTGEPCPAGCGCVTEEDPDRRDCACEGPCCTAPNWPNYCRLDGPHCQVCGTPLEECRRPMDAYSACCNERIVEPDRCETPELHHEVNR